MDITPIIVFVSALAILTFGVVYTKGNGRIIMIITGVVVFGFGYILTTGVRLGVPPPAGAKVFSTPADATQYSAEKFPLTPDQLPTRGSGEATVSAIIDIQQVGQRVGTENTVFIITSNAARVSTNNTMSDDNARNATGNAQSALKARTVLRDNDEANFMTVAQNGETPSTLNVRVWTKQNTADQAPKPLVFRVPNVPVHRPFLLTCVLSQGFASVQVDCELRETRRVNQVVLYDDRGNGIHGIVGYAGGFIGTVQNLMLSNTAWAPENVASMCRGVPSTSPAVTQSTNTVAAPTAADQLATAAARDPAAAFNSPL